MKTIRFATLVRKAGKPQPHLAWAGAAKDPQLKKAAQQQYLLSIHQQLRGAKKDFGTVGLETGRDVQYFVFPRSLKSFADARVVGIDYGLVDAKLTVAAVPPATKSKSRIPSGPKRPKKDGNVIAFPSGSSGARAEPKPEKLTAPPAPPSPVGWPETHREIAAALGELRRRKVAAGRDRLTALLARLPR